MYWIKEMQSAIGFIEGRLTEELSLDEIARSANSSRLSSREFLAS